MAGSFIIFIGTLVSGIYNFVCALFTKKAQDQTERNEVRAYLCSGIIFSVIQISMGVLIAVHAVYANRTFELASNSVNKLSYLNGCSDSLTTVNSQLYSNIISDGRKALKPMEALGYVMIGLGCLSILFVIIGTIIAHVRGFHDPERQ